jgi:hypothetical protein
LPSFGEVFVYAKFKTNQAEIVKTICVQRKLVFNTCNGRCELQKSLKKFEDNEKKMQNNLKEKLELVYVAYFSAPKLHALIYSQTNKLLFSYLAQKTISVTNTTFHPPACFI